MFFKMNKSCPVSGIVFMKAMLLFFVFTTNLAKAETSDAYERIMKSGTQSALIEESEAGRSPSVDDIPTPPVEGKPVHMSGFKKMKVSAANLQKAADIDEAGGGDSADDSYVLQRGDVVTIRIYPEDQYVKGGKMEVSSEGNITLPLVGKVAVAGKNIINAERALVEIIDRDYLVNPEVVIEVERHKKQSIVILGQVKKPGPYEMPVGANKLTLLQAIAQAGGFTEVANIKKIKIVRQGEGKSQVISANGDAIISGKDQDIELEPGDAVNVSESLF